MEVTPAGRFIVAEVDGITRPITVEEYKERLAARLVEEAPTLETFRERWIIPVERRDLVDKLVKAGNPPKVLIYLEDLQEFDLYDVLAEIGYGMAPRTRRERADAFEYKHAAWLASLPGGAAKTLTALAEQFAHAGTEGLENREVFATSQVRQAGGLNALKALGRPKDILQETKKRIFAA